MILRKIIKIAATRCHILKLKCTKFDFGWGSAADPAWGSYSTPPDLLAGFKWPSLLREGRGRSQKGEGEGGKGKGSEGIGEGEGGEGEWGSPTVQPTIFGLKVALSALDLNSSTE